MRYFETNVQFIIIMFQLDGSTNVLADKTTKLNGIKVCYGARQNSIFVEDLFQKIKLYILLFIYKKL